MKVIPAQRHKARHFAMQALYQWQMTGANINAIEAEFHADNDMKHVDKPFFSELLHYIPAHSDELEALFSPYLQGRALGELDHITRALLWIATYELEQRIEVPYRVVINEGVGLAKKFGATDSFKFMNAVLDATAAQLRKPEVSEKRS